MPFSFIEIEESKTRVIALVFIFIIIFYFFTAYLLLIVIENGFAVSALETTKGGFFLPPAPHVLAALIIAFIAAFLHWSFSTDNLIAKMCLAVGALPADPKDTYHQYFKNIVDEVSVAMGGRRIQAAVIDSVGMNAFSLEDFEKFAVIGVTEGLLARLNRAQIEAVVAHEAGHIAAGDSLTTTVICSLAELYEDGLSGLKAGLRRVRGRGIVVLLLVFLVLSIMNSLSKLLRYFISRQREYRADAISVRLTRDPLSLAEALKIISGHWRGAGAPGEKIESIFIVNPNYSSLDEEQGLAADMFSTHPPIRTRINILLGMAHIDAETLEETLKNFKRASPVAAAEFKPLEDSGPRKWFILERREWRGPFSLEELGKTRALSPEQWVRIEGRDEAIPAYEDPKLQALFVKSEDKTEAPVCPHCKAALQEVNYEGVPVLKCVYCAGYFVEHGKIGRIFIREDATFSDETVRLAKPLISSKDKFRLNNTGSKNVWVINCPKCGHTMHRQFFVYSYPVEIDRCVYCSGIWFDRQELELLQYLYEHKELYFEKGQF